MSTPVKEYTKNNIDKIKKIQTLYRTQKKRKDAIKTIRQFRNRKQSLNTFANLKTARKIFHKTIHENVNVNPINITFPTAKKAVSVRKRLFEEPRTKPNFTVVRSTFKPQNHVASFKNEHGKIMNLPIPLENAKYFSKHNRHPVNWQLFGKRPTEPSIQTYQNHMLSVATKNLKTPIKNQQFSRAIHNKNAAREYVTNLFRLNKNIISKKKLKSILIQECANMKVDTFTDIYFKYPKSNKKIIYYIPKNVIAYKLDEVLTCKKFDQTKVVLKIRISKKVKPASVTYGGYVVQESVYNTFTQFYGKTAHIQESRHLSL